MNWARRTATGKQTADKPCRSASDKQLAHARLGLKVLEVCPLWADWVMSCGEGSAHCNDPHENSIAEAHLSLLTVQRQNVLKTATSAQAKLDQQEKQLSAKRAVAYPELHGDAGMQQAARSAAPPGTITGQLRAARQSAKVQSTINSSTSPPVRALKSMGTSSAGGGGGGARRPRALTPIWASSDSDTERDVTGSSSPTVPRDVSAGVAPLQHVRAAAGSDLQQPSEPQGNATPAATSSSSSQQQPGTQGSQPQASASAVSLIKRGASAPHGGGLAGLRATGAQRRWTHERRADHRQLGLRVSESEPALRKGTLQAVVGSPSLAPVLRASPSQARGRGGAWQRRGGGKARGLKAATSQAPQPPAGSGGAHNPPLAGATQGAPPKQVQGGRRVSRALPGSAQELGASDQAANAANSANAASSLLSRRHKRSITILDPLTDSSFTPREGIPSLTPGGAEDGGASSLSQGSPHSRRRPSQTTEHIHSSPFLASRALQRQLERQVHGRPSTGGDAKHNSDSDTASTISDGARSDTGADGVGVSHPLFPRDGTTNVYYGNLVSLQAEDGQFLTVDPRSGVVAFQTPTPEWERRGIEPFPTFAVAGALQAWGGASHSHERNPSQGGSRRGDRGGASHAAAADPPTTLSGRSRPRAVSPSPDQHRPLSRTG